MHTHGKTTRRPNKRITKCFAMLLAILMLVQTMAIGVGAAIQDWALSTGNLDPSLAPSGIGNITSDELMAQLKKDLIKSFNQDLVKRVDEFEMSGPVGVILTFSDDSVISSYTSSVYADRMTYDEFRATNAAERLGKKMLSNQNAILDKLMDAGLIDDVKYNYTHLMDGAYIATTYENLAAICEVEGVERVMISNTYLPQAAVNNPVDVYDTGIFNSGSVDYTGKGTLVAVLDTGCDYTHSAFTTYAVAEPAFDRDRIASFLESTKAYELSGGLEAREVYYGNITANKIAFGYDYADKDPDIMPFENSHGTHVAGIIAGKDDKIIGVAIDAQLAIMKVFSDYDAGAEEGDILAALEDSIILGVDAINMSLGSSCGFSYESDPDKAFKNEVYSRIEEVGISLVVAASNDYSSGFGNEQGNTNKTDNPDSATVGSPSTYKGAMSVASINGNKDKYMLANGNMEVFFNQSTDTAGDEYDFFKILGIETGDKVTYEYVTIPGHGMTINYAGLDVNGKIALVRRGDITFEEKVQYAQEAGAIAVIIYNNVFGDILMTIGNDAKIPAVSIGKDDGDILAASPSGTIEFDLANVAGPFMSDFSSWGPNPDLSLKPEITAHGGNIVSAIIGNDYDKQSGTSMAAPNMCGITVLIRQYVKENYQEQLELSDTQVRDLVNQLCMSTATIALDKKGNPYSPRKQGAGIADIRKATTTPAYLYVDGIGKTKLELRDDPQRTGVYTMSINLANISDESVSYRLGNITMTESVSTSDPEYVAEIAYLLSNSSQYSVEGGTWQDGVVTVEAGKTAKITVTLTLSDADKSYLNATFENGMYVEGFLTFNNMEENGVDLNAPFLAFYGDWGEAPIFDLDYYEVETEAHNNAIDEDDKIKADYYPTTPTGSYYYDYILPLGSYVYQMDESMYSAIPGTMEHAAISYYADSISGLYGVFAGLLRGAKEMNITIVNTTTGEVVWEETQYNCYKAHYNNGSPYPYVADVRLPTVNRETGEVLGDNNTKLQVTMSAKLDWDGGENASDTYTFSFYIDYEAPTVTDAEFITEYDKSREENRYYLELMVYDNHYAMSCRPIIVYDSNEMDENGNPKKTYSSLCEYPIPIYQENRGEVTKVRMEITDYIDLIADSSMPNGITIYLDDYAMNSSVSYIPFPGTDEKSQDLEFVEPGEINIDIHETVDLTKLLVFEDTAIPVQTDYLKTLKWAIKDDEGVVALDGGQLEGLKSGTAIIMVTSDSWVTPTKVGEMTVSVPIYKTLVVNVSENKVKDNPLSGENALIEDLQFSSYKTLFAFNSDIDYSEIGETGSTHYFGGNYSISCYPSEQIQLSYDLKPWNLAPHRYKLTWTSSNPKVATVDQNGVVTAESEGRARITLNISVDGKTSLLAARLSVEVKSEFIIENRTLIAYKGKGGDVMIPDDEGIVYIGAFAFSHFNLDNEKEVEKDENGYYDMDDKKTPLGNDTVTSVVIPEGVETINKYAFYNCSALRSVKLPESCTTIGEYAFTYCSILENVNFDHVKVVSDYAFYKCESLSCNGIVGGANVEKIYTVGAYGFAGTRFEQLRLLSLSRTGEGAFLGCTKLTTVELGKKTRIANKMFAGSGVQEIIVWSDTIADEAFAECEKLTSVTFMNDLTYLGDSAFLNCKKLNEVNFEAGVEQIAPYAFFGCSALKELALPEGTIAIGDGAFGSTGLKKLTLAKTTQLSTIGVSAFEDLNGLSLEWELSDFYKLENDVLYAKDGKTLVMVLPSTTMTSFTVPARVTTIGDGAFSSLKRLSTVTFENGSELTTIGDAAFANCTKLATITLPEQEIKIGDYAFFWCSALRNMDLSHVSEIGAFGFAQSAVTSVDLGTAGVKLGNSAFYLCERLTDLTIANNAVIGEYCFAESGVKTVDLAGDATLGTAAFYLCQSLESFDFEDLTGGISDYAFYGCVSLSAVVAPKITAIGESAFGDCYSLATLEAESVKTIGIGAFAPLAKEAYYANLLKDVNLPALQSVQEGAFYLCSYLESIYAPALTAMGETAFYMCTSLKSATFSDEFVNVPGYAFCGCIALKEFDFSHLVTIGDAAFYGVPLPTTLTLNKVESIGMSAFLLLESNDPSLVVENNLASVIAPELVSMGEQAFAYCSKLKTVTAPKLRQIGMAAFAYTAIEELEISNALETIEMGAFEGCESFKAFFVKDENGNPVYEIELSNIMLKNGALYTVRNGDYVLVCYPAAREGSELVVEEGTVRIAVGAAMNNPYLTHVVLPSTLKSIGNFAFYGCSELETVTFRSYYAPVLEGTMSGVQQDITYDNLAEYPGFEKLYGYDYFYRLNYAVTMPLYYNTFIDTIGSRATENLVAELPDNCVGYDALLYDVYFTISEETSGVTAGQYAIAFIDAVKNLPDTVDRFNKAEIGAAIYAYNALVDSADKAYVDDALFEKFYRARRAYNVSVAENKIAHLFDVYMNEYSFEKVKDARATYLALTDEERAEVENADRLQAKIAELGEAFGREIDFTLGYADHLPEEKPPVVDPPVVGDNDGVDAWVIVVIVAASVVVLAAAAVVIIMIRKKKNV